MIQCRIHCGTRVKGLPRESNCHWDPQVGPMAQQYNRAISLVAGPAFMHNTARKYACRSRGAAPAMRKTSLPPAKMPLKLYA